MAASITYTATNPTTGASWTRSSGTMEYTHVLLVGTDAADAGPISWHKSHAAGFKAANTGYMQQRWAVRTLVPAVPTSITGKVTQAYVDAWAMDTTNPNAAAIAQLAADKLAAQTAPKAKAAPATFADKLAAADQAAATTGLVWTARTPKLGHTAKGAKHVYRTLRTQDGGWWAQQRGANGSWTPVGGKCPGQAQAQDLAARYEGGERDLSHKAKRGMTYAQLTPGAQAAS